MPSLAQLQAAFAAFDVSSDGTISKEELVRILTRRTGSRPPLSKQAAEALFRNMDRNGDGRIDYEEFAAAWQNDDQPAGIERNLSGAVILGTAAPVGVATDGKHGVELGVRMSHLKKLLTETEPGWTTLEVVEKVIKPRTSGFRCRYADLQSVRDLNAVGRATAFASHTWGNLFRDLVGTLSYVLDDETFVWLDIIAVNQWRGAEQQSDLDFAPVVQACGALILCAAYLESLKELRQRRKKEGSACYHIDNVPLADRRRCAFWRGENACDLTLQHSSPCASPRPSPVAVWCLVELAAALTGDIPVVMLVGTTDSNGVFTPEFSGMRQPLMEMVNVEDAEATVPTDKDLILNNLVPGLLGVDSREAGVAAGVQRRPAASDGP